VTIPNYCPGGCGIRLERAGYCGGKECGDKLRSEAVATKPREYSGYTIVTSVDRNPGELKCSIPDPTLVLGERGDAEACRNRTVMAREIVEGHISSKFFQGLSPYEQMTELRRFAAAWIEIAAQHNANEDFYADRVRQLSRQVDGHVHKIRCMACNGVSLTGDAFHHVSLKNHGPCVRCRSFDIVITCPPHCDEVRLMRRALKNHGCEPPACTEHTFCNRKVPG
jgi:hypothetical protein